MTTMTATIMKQTMSLTITMAMVAVMVMIIKMSGYQDRLVTKAVWLPRPYGYRGLLARQAVWPRLCQAIGPFASEGKTKAVSLPRPYSGRPTIRKSHLEKRGSNYFRTPRGCNSFKKFRLVT